MTESRRRAIRRLYGDLANLTPGELRAHVDGHATPMRGNPSPRERELSRRLLALREKDEAELTDGDHELMAQAISRIHLLLRQRPEGPVRCSAWRRRLLLLGHDPLRPRPRLPLAAEG
jgi:hypothetical protein